MSLIDDKKANATDVLIKTKKFLINISISLAVYILIFIIGSLTMFACNVSEAKIFDKDCADINKNIEKVEVPINVIKNTSIITKYFLNKYIDEQHEKSGGPISHEDIDANFKIYLDENRSNDIFSIFQILESNKKNKDKLMFCIDDNESKNFGIFTNSIKYTINFIYSMIKLYTTFLNTYISEIFILWISPIFSLLLLIFLIFTSFAYFFYKMIVLSISNIFDSIFTNFFKETILNKIKQIIIAHAWIYLTIFITIFGFVLAPIFSFCLVLYSIFNIFIQNFKKKESESALKNENYGNYGIFQKMADNLIYKKGYNIIIILIICIINVFLFDQSIGGIVFALILIFYYIFYKKLNLQEIPLNNFNHLYNKSQNETLELG